MNMLRVEHPGESGLIAEVSGASMAPTLPLGSRVLFAPLREVPRAGDILVLRDGRGDLVVHRLRAVHAGGTLLTQGDGCARPDPDWQPAALLGRVVAMRPKGAGGDWQAERPLVRSLLLATMSDPDGRLGLRLRRLLARWAWRPLDRIEWRERLRVVPDAADLAEEIKGTPNGTPDTGGERSPRPPRGETAPTPQGQADFDVQRLGNEWAILDRSTGEIHILNATAGMIWELDHEGLAREAIAQRLQDVFPQVSLETLSRDVDTVLSKLPQNLKTRRSPTLS